MPKPTLEVLQGGSAADSRAALRDLYSKYGGSVFGRCSYLLKDRSKAEDAMQDVFAKALTHLAEFRSEASPLTWLMKIATHHCLNVLRAERAPWHQRFRRHEQARGEGHGGPQLFEDREAVRHLLSRCDLETQAAAVHYYVDEMTLEEIAKLLGRSVPTIRKRLESFTRLSQQEYARRNQSESQSNQEKQS
jgi:RNA polymerase sigma-70 factor (ECF subfamily)